MNIDFMFYKVENLEYLKKILDMYQKDNYKLFINKENGTVKIEYTVPILENERYQCMVELLLREPINLIMPPNTETLTFSFKLGSVES